MDCPLAMPTHLGNSSSFKCAVQINTKLDRFKPIQLVDVHVYMGMH